jgi:hypothetical protein
MKTYTGGCHCGKVRYQAELDLFAPVLECNCSHCQAKGMLLSFVDASKFTLESGEEFLTEYRFNTEKIAHLFCKVCGVQAFGRGEKKDGSPTVAVNVRSVDEVDVPALKRLPIDGRSF